MIINNTIYIIIDYLYHSFLSVPLSPLYLVKLLSFPSGIVMFTILLSTRIIVKVISIIIGQDRVMVK